MMLSDGSIRRLLDFGRIQISPTPPDSAMQPASVDLTLGNEFIKFGRGKPFTVRSSLWIGPGDCVLATTAERIEIPADVVGRVEGKSTWGRKFLMVHSTAGFIDPGFQGQITLELKNLSDQSLNVKVGAPIAQISFQVLDAEALRPYGSEGLGSHYQNQKGVVPAAVGTHAY